MDEIIKKTIYDSLLNLRDDAASFTFSEGERRKYIRWAYSVYIELCKLFSRNSVLSKEFKNLLELSRQRRIEFPIDLFKSLISKINILASTLERINSEEKVSFVSDPSPIPATKNVFIIHGHDELNTHRLINLLQNDFQLHPLAIFLKPGQSRTILEKFENHADTCSFAFALFSKDDEIINRDEKFFQARPNVIFEAGWFTGRLGKNRILLLLQNDVKIHSDFDGISRIQFNLNIEEKYKEIKMELEAVNLI